MDAIFDIETMRIGSMIDALPTPDVKTGNVKDAGKIEEKIAAAKAKQIESMALSPLFGRVCAAAVTMPEGGMRSFCIAGDDDEQEAYVLECLFKEMAGSRIVTYNGNNFDLPFIYRRAVILGINPVAMGMPTLAEVTARYRNDRHIDIMQVWCCNHEYEKLDNVAKAITGGMGKLEIDFRDFPELIKAEEGRKKIMEYCRQDVEITAAIWAKIKGILI